MNFKRWNVFGEWLTAPGVSDSHAWMASLGYGNYDIKKAHTYSVRGQYYYEEANSPIFSSAFAPAYSFYNQHYVDNKGVAHVRNGFKGFVAMYHSKTYLSALTMASVIKIWTVIN